MRAHPKTPTEQSCATQHLRPFKRLGLQKIGHFKDWTLKNCK